MCIFLTGSKNYTFFIPYTFKIILLWYRNTNKTRKSWYETNSGTDFLNLKINELDLLSYFGPSRSVDGTFLADFSINWSQLLVQTIKRNVRQRNVQESICRIFESTNGLYFVAWLIVHKADSRHLVRKQIKSLGLKNTLVFPKRQWDIKR